MTRDQAIDILHRYRLPIDDSPLPAAMRSKPAARAECQAAKDALFPPPAPPPEDTTPKPPRPAKDDRLPAEPNDRLTLRAAARAARLAPSPKPSKPATRRSKEVKRG